MVLTKLELIEKLPLERNFWFAKEIAECFGVTTRTIQRAAVKYEIGKKLRHGPRGIFVFQPQDLQALCNHIHGVAGNPINMAKSRGEYVQKNS